MKCDYEYYKSVVADLDDDCKYLVDYLNDNTSFFIQPASYKYHHDYFGGLAIHCMEIYQELCKYVENQGLPYDKSTLFLIAVGHDFDKLGRYQYEPEQKNFSYKFFKMDGMFHGSRGYSLLKKYLDGRLENRSDNHMIEVCISGHMGECGKWNVEKEYWENHKHIDLVVLTHKADMTSSQDLNGRDFERIDYKP